MIDEIIINENGSAAVEFALVLPFLFLILFAIIDYGWFFTNQLIITNAVSAGARTAIKSKEWDGENPREDAKEMVKEAFWLFTLNDTDIKCVIIPDDREGDAPRRIEVKVSALPYTSITGFLPESFLPSSIMAKAVMVFP